ncbi:MAG: hypothetical protein M1819_005934 [Sarea resinae]|nr:MAG: hypothetical protein M1819_005934 [Sarea resinae]
MDRELPGYDGQERVGDGQQALGGALRGQVCGNDSNERVGGTSGRYECEFQAEDEDKESVIMSRISQGTTGIDNHASNCGARHVGIRNLYISENRVTVTGIGALIATSRLRVLDCGRVASSKQQRTGVGGPWGSQSTSQQNEEGRAAQEILSSLVTTNHNAFSNLHYLRISHHIVTGDAALFDRVSSPVSYRDCLTGWPSWSGNLEDLPLVERGNVHWSPLMRIRKLVLTGVPSLSEKGFISKALQTFIHVCAEAEAEAKKATNSSSNGFSRRQHHGRALRPHDRSPPTDLLEEVHLELADAEMLEDDFDPIVAGATFRESLEGDFSFFANDRRDQAGGPKPVINAFDEAKINAERLGQRDVVFALSRDRAACRQASERAAFAESNALCSHGCWSGKVKVIRPEQ